MNFFTRNQIKDVFLPRQGKLFSKESIRTILKNPLYVGMVRYKDKAYRGEHEGIVDKKKFKRFRLYLRRIKEKEEE